MTGDVRWQWTYTAIILLATFAVATAATYLIEHPAARRILAWRSKDREPMIEMVPIDGKDAEGKTRRLSQKKPNSGDK
jgi:peptidoglycan/LPS O-acetylase OafA/YrhL